MIEIEKEIGTEIGTGTETETATGIEIGIEIGDEVVEHGKLSDALVQGAFSSSFLTLHHPLI